MSEEIMNSDDSYSDDEEEEEELDPRIQDELEKLNAATNSINHLEAELDEARAVFRQTLAGATYHLNAIAQKLGKSVEKSRPFYESYRQLRQSHGMLQKSTNQFERATGMHVAAKTRVLDAENRVFGGGPKRAFDAALQEMLNQATIEVNEAEKLKRDSWKQHQEDLKAYRDLELKVKKLYKKLKSSVDKSKPYFEQKKEFDRHLWQLKLRVDSILLGLSGAKENYSDCLKSLEIISDEIHEKRKSKRMEMVLSKLQEREAGVGADSSTEEETSLSASNLDLDFDSSLNFDKLDELSDGLTKNFQDLSTAAASSSYSLSHVVSMGTKERNSLDMNHPPTDTRVVYGLEATENKSVTSVVQTEVEKDELVLDKSSRESEDIKEESNEESTDIEDRPDEEDSTNTSAVQIEAEKDVLLPDNSQEMKPEDDIGKDKAEDEHEKASTTDKESIVDKMQEDHEEIVSHEGFAVPENLLEKETVPQDPEQLTKNEELECNVEGSKIQRQNLQVEETSQENDESVQSKDSESATLSSTHNQESTQEELHEEPSSKDHSSELSNNSEAKADEPESTTNEFHENEDHTEQLDVSTSPENDTNASLEKTDQDESTAVDECTSQETDS